MGRLSSFLGGVLTGGAAYASLSLWSQSEFSRIDHQVRAIHLELAGGAAKSLPPPEGGMLNVGPLADFKKEALDSFRKKWNQSLRSTYDAIKSQLRPKSVVTDGNKNGEISFEEPEDNIAEK